MYVIYARTNKKEDYMSNRPSAYQNSDFQIFGFAISGHKNIHKEVSL